MIKNTELIYFKNVIHIRSGLGLNVSWEFDRYVERNTISFWAEPLKNLSLSLSLYIYIYIYIYWFIHLSIYLVFRYMVTYIWLIKSITYIWQCHLPLTDEQDNLHSKKKLWACWFFQENKGRKIFEESNKIKAGEDNNNHWRLTGRSRSNR